MTHDAFETVELGQAEALIELGLGTLEEVQEKFDSATPSYTDFES